MWPAALVLGLVNVVSSLGALGFGVAIFPAVLPPLPVPPTLSDLPVVAQQFALPSQEPGQSTPEPVPAPPTSIPIPGPLPPAPVPVPPAPLPPLPTVPVPAPVTTTTTPLPLPSLPIEHPNTDPSDDLTDGMK